jgi:hypothetical protein
VLYVPVSVCEGVCKWIAYGLTLKMVVLYCVPLPRTVYATYTPACAAGASRASSALSKGEGRVTDVAKPTVPIVAPVATHTPSAYE